MDYFQLLEEALVAEVRAGRFGSPVFFRAAVELSSDHGHLLPLASAWTALAARVLDAPCERVLALGGPARGHASVQAILAGGHGALLGVAVRHGRPRLDLLLIGNRGTVRHAPPPELLEDAAASDAVARFAAGAPEALTRALEASLGSGAPARVGNGG